MAAKMVSVILAAAAALALVSQMAGASSEDDHKMYQFCKRVNAKMELEPDSWKSSAVAYKTAMRHVKSGFSLFSRDRRCLAAAWRAVTSDEPCSSKSLAYAHAIYACHPSSNPSQRHLISDVRKYAQKCFTSDYLEREFEKFASADLEKFLPSNLVAAHYEANPPQRWIGLVRYEEYHGTADRAKEMVAKSLARDFPQQAEQIRALPELAKKLVGKLLDEHLYKSCDSYLKRADKLIGQMKAAAAYALDDDPSRLPQNARASAFRYKFCQNVRYPAQRDDFNMLVAHILPGTSA